MNNYKGPQAQPFTVLIFWNMPIRFKDFQISSFTKDSPQGLYILLNFVICFFFVIGGAHRELS